jgi:hypothetical protein
MQEGRIWLDEAEREAWRKLHFAVITAAFVFAGGLASTSRL